MAVEVVGRLGQVRYSPGGGTVRIIATGDSTRNTYFALENTEAPGGGTPLHCHTREDEFFFVVEGELTLFVGGKIIKLGAGESIFAPRNVPHSFKNCSTANVRFLVFCTPWDVEPFFDYGLPTASGGRPSDEELVKNILELAPKYGIQILGPSPL